MKSKTFQAILAVGMFTCSFVGCETDETNPFHFQDFSYLPAPSRTDVRTAHRLFVDHPSSPYNVLKGFDVIEDEGLRLYLYDELTTDFSFENLILILTETLPEVDYW
ncbi:MAG: hypothetical protein VX223_10725, partial [Myxococcota bacterium]|nr:hypothetical protein [Myxococcota bacterium]